MAKPELILAYDLKDLNELREREGIGYCRFILTSFLIENQSTVYAKIKWTNLKSYVETDKARKGTAYPTTGKTVKDKCKEKGIKLRKPKKVKK